MEIYSNYSLKKLNTFGLDVYTSKLVKIRNEKDIGEFINKFNTSKDDILILGGGSNLLFRNNFSGIILKTEIEGIKEIRKTNDSIVLEIGNGVIWDDLVEYCVSCGYGGIENLAYIPGTVGAAPIQNIGAYGVEFQDVFVSLEGIDFANGEKKEYLKQNCEFGYRESIFKSSLKNKFLITKVRIQLSTKPEINTSYRAVEEYIRKNDLNKNSLSIKDIRDIITEIRKSKLPEPDELGNAGSFFKNPIITESDFNKLKKKNKDLVYFLIGKGKYKIPAAWLIEKIGYKGKRKGNVGVHTQQALVLVNYGNATGNEIVDFAYKIQSEILRKFNIHLETEVNIVQNTGEL